MFGRCSIVVCRWCNCLCLLCIRKSRLCFQGIALSLCLCRNSISSVRFECSLGGFCRTCLPCMLSSFRSILVCMLAYQCTSCYSGSFHSLRSWAGIVRNLLPVCCSSLLHCSLCRTCSLLWQLKHTIPNSRNKRSLSDSLQLRYCLCVLCSSRLCNYGLYCMIGRLVVLAGIGSDLVL